MGVPGLWEALTPARERRSIYKDIKDNGVPVTAAIDFSIWTFQCAAASGGPNPTLRTFYYRLCRLARCGIRAVFVFDGPDRPKFKRGKVLQGRVGDFSWYKALIQAFGFTVWQAPGEAEAEAAQLQARGFVDVVISDDVDALLFGATMVYKGWAAIGPSDKQTSHLSHTYTYHARTISRLCRIDSAGMILVALLSGGDYIQAGLPKCGIKTAIQVAQAGYGASLQTSENELNGWRAQLQEDLMTNKSRHYTSKHPALKVPEDFPDVEVFRYYNKPIVSSVDVMSSRASLFSGSKVVSDIDLSALQVLTQKFFQWTGSDGQLKLSRTLAPAILVRDLMRQVSGLQNPAGTRSASQVDHNRISAHLEALTICGKRQHESTDMVPELRIEYKISSIVSLDPALYKDESSSTTDSVLADTEDDSSSISDIVPQVDGTEDQIPPTQQEAILIEPDEPPASSVSDAARIWIPQALVEAAMPEKFAQWSIPPTKVKSKKAEKVDTRQRSIMDYYKSNKSTINSEASTKDQNDGGETSALENEKSAASRDQAPHILTVSKEARGSRVKNKPEASTSRPVRGGVKLAVNTVGSRTVRSSTTRAQQASLPQVISLDDTDSECEQPSVTIKTFFSTTKSINKESAKTKVNETSQPRLDAESSGEMSEEQSSRSIVLRKSLPGHWRPARDHDESAEVHTIDRDAIIDLSTA